MTATAQGKEYALEQLANRRRAYKDSDWARVTASLPAGSQMYYGCIGCNNAITVPEDWLHRPQLCRECQALKDLGWL